MSVCQATAMQQTTHTDNCNASRANWSSHNQAQNCLNIFKHMTNTCNSSEVICMLVLGADAPNELGCGGGTFCESG